MGKLHNVFDRRTGYFVIAKPAGWFDAHPNGEGNEKVFTIIESDEPLKNLALAELKQHDYSCKIDLTALAVLEKANAVASPLKNVVSDKALALVAGSLADFNAEITKVNTLKNAVLTVGTGKTYATIAAAHTASSAGDVVECYATGSNTYTEALAIVSGKPVVFRGMVANQGIKISYNSGATVTAAQQATGWRIENFTIDTTSNSGIGFNYTSGTSVTDPFVLACKFTNSSGSAGTTIGVTSNNSGAIPPAVNCLISGFATGAAAAASTRIIALDNCTITGCTLGVTSLADDKIVLTSCLVAGNTTDFDTTYTMPRSVWCVSADATASGIAAVTGFDVNDFNADKTLKTSVAATTKARMYGYPLRREDGSGKICTRSGYFYAGWSTAAPAYIPVAAEVLSSVTAYGLDNELAGSATGEAHTNDEVLASASVPGNYDDSNLVDGNVKLGVAYGLGDTGSYAGVTQNFISGTPVAQTIVPVPIQNTETTIYTCPADKKALVRLTLCNVDSSARTCTPHKVLSGESASDANALKKNIALAIAGNDGDDWVDVVRTLEEGDKISAVASVSDKVIAHLEVVEIPVSAA